MTRSLSPRFSFIGSFYFLDPSFTETKRLNFGLSPKVRLTNHRGAHYCSLHNVIADVITYISVFLCIFMNKRKSEVIFIHQNLISNRLTYLVHAKSTDKLISFGFSDRSVRSLVSAKRSANRFFFFSYACH